MAEPAVADPFEDLGQQREAATVGMWVFLASEVLFFGALFLVFFVGRLLHPDAFRAAAGELDLWLGTANTAVLLTSSLTMALAVHAHQTGARRRLTGWLLATALLGAVFLGVKGLEWSHEVEQGYLPGPDFRWPGADAGPAEMFFTLYFVTTAFHALHLVVGVGMLLLLALWNARSRGSTVEVPVEVPGLYWHFVDVVWIFLFPTLYLLGPR
jgi:cytochrome c oxidase subunit III